LVASVVLKEDVMTWLIGGIFYDVGSGSGRGVFAATLLHNFDKAEGIEILTGLHAVRHLPPFIIRYRQSFLHS
jgi:hypothetical protein